MDLQKFREYKEDYGYFRLNSIDWSYIKLVFSNRCMRMYVYFTEMGDNGVLGMLEMYHALRKRQPYDFIAYDDVCYCWTFRIMKYSTEVVDGEKMEYVVLSVQVGDSIRHGAFFHQEYPVEYLECLFENFFKDVAKHPNYPVRCYWMDKDNTEGIKMHRDMLNNLTAPKGWHTRRMKDVPAVLEYRKKLLEEI